MAMQRPCWTISFVIICLLVVPGAILTHLSVGTLIPTISDLPANLVKGFDEVFKFAHLEKDSGKVKTSSAAPLKECGVVSPLITCPAFSPNPAVAAQQATIQTAVARADIKQAFATSLSVVSKIANDKYFGSADLKSTADNLNKMTAELNKITDTMKCYEAIPTFCAIFKSADGLVSGMAEVNKALDAFKNGDIVKQWDKNKGMLTFLHALPYLTFLSLLLFACFWWLGGVCCCCRGGTKLGSCAIIPSMLLWFTSFGIYAVVMVSGILVSNFQNKIEVPVLKGKPTLDVAIAHIQTNYPEFWNVVFSDMVDGLDGLLMASYFFVAVCVLQAFYSSLEMCCCPYRAKAEKPSAEGAAPADATAPTTPGLLNAPAESTSKPDVEQPAEAAEAAKPQEEPVTQPAESVAKPDVEQPAEAAAAAQPQQESQEVEM